jgi:hypothetical protein
MNAKRMSAGAAVPAGSPGSLGSPGKPVARGSTVWALVFEKVR